MLCGGLSQFYEVDEECRCIFQEAHAKLITFIHDSNDLKETIQLIGYRKQIVCGINYFLKVQIDQQIKWIKLHQALPCHGGEITVVEILDENQIK